MLGTTLLVLLGVLCILNIVIAIEESFFDDEEDWEDTPAGRMFCERYNSNRGDLHEED